MERSGWIKYDDDDPKMYHGEYVYEQMSLEEFLMGAKNDNSKSNP